MKARFYALLTVLTVLTLLLSACTAKPAAAPAQTGATTTEGQAPAGGKTKVVWWTEQPATPKYQDLIQKEFVDTFNAAHPDIELQVLFQQNLDQVLRPAIQAGAAPDIIQTPGPSFVLEYVNAGFIDPLDAYSDKYGWKGKLLPWAYDSGLVEGKLYGLPLTYETMVMYYNKPLFEKMGWKVPTTRAELETLCEAAAKEKINCFAQTNQPWKGVNEWLVGVMYNNSVGADNVYKALQGQKPWTDAEFVDSVQMLADWSKKGWLTGSVENYFSLAWADIYNMVCKDQAAIMFAGTWAFQDWPQYCNDKWEWAPTPSLKEGVPSVFELAIGSTVSINGKSPNKDAAAAVLDWIYNDKARAAKIIEGFNFGEWNVPLKFTAQDFSKEVDPRFTRFVEEFGKATGDGQFGYTTWTFWPAKTDQYIIQELDSVLTGDQTAADYMQGQQKQFDTEIKAAAVPPAPPTKVQTSTK